MSPLELFFDLVFVFAFTQITGMTAGHTAAGVGRALLVFAVLWWSWGAYAWLTNAVDTSATGPRLVILLAAASMLVTALAVPTAWEDGGVAFALGHLVVMALHGGAVRAGGREGTPGRHPPARTHQPGSGAGAGGGRPGRRHRPGVLWVVAVAVTYAGPYVSGVAGFTVPRPPGRAPRAHRHHRPRRVGGGHRRRGRRHHGRLGPGRLRADRHGAHRRAVVGLLRPGGRGRRGRAGGRGGVDRARLARDVYSYLHIPLVLGVVFAAVGIHEALVHPGEPLDPVFAATFAGGVVLYLGGLAAIRLRRGSPGSPLPGGAGRGRRHGARGRRDRRPGDRRRSSPPRSWAWPSPRNHAAGCLNRRRDPGYPRRGLPRREGLDRRRLPVLHDYIRIPNVSVAYDADWAEAGHMARWTCSAVVRAGGAASAGGHGRGPGLPGRTPLLLVDVPPAGGGRATPSCLRHLDKQPPVLGWRDELRPWEPVVEATGSTAGAGPTTAIRRSRRSRRWRPCRRPAARTAAAWS